MEAARVWRRKWAGAERGGERGGDRPRFDKRAGGPPRAGSGFGARPSRPFSAKPAFGGAARRPEQVVARGERGRSGERGGERPRFDKRAGGPPRAGSGFGSATEQTVCGEAGFGGAREGGAGSRTAESGLASTRKNGNRADRILAASLASVRQADLRVRRGNPSVLKEPSVTGLRARSSRATDRRSPLRRARCGAGRGQELRQAHGKQGALGSEAGWRTE